MAEGKASTALSRLDQINREMVERRGLRERKAAEAKEQAKESLKKQGPVAERTTQHLVELAKRQRGAGGWATEKALADKDKVMGFGPEDEQPEVDDARPFNPYGVAASSAVPSSAPPQPEEPKPFAEPAERKHSRSVAPAAPEPEPEPPKSPPPPRRPARHAREESFDDDDFSNNSWLK